MTPQPRVLRWWLGERRNVETPTTIPGWAPYCVTTDGRLWEEVYSPALLKNFWAERVRRRKNEIRLTRSIDGKTESRLFSIGHLVLMTFRPTDQPGLVVRFINENPRDRRLSNLEWAPLEEKDPCVPSRDST